MTLTEDELARLAELEDLLTVGLVEQPINGSVLSWGEAALIAHRIGRHLLRDTPVADTAGIDAAWAAAEAALPEHWEIELSVGGHGNRDLYTALASYCYSLRHYRENVGRARSTPFEMTHADSPAAALLALAAALRTPKPEGDR